MGLFANIRDYQPYKVFHESVNLRILTFGWVRPFLLDDLASQVGNVLENICRIITAIFYCFITTLLISQRDTSSNFSVTIDLYAKLN